MSIKILVITSNPETAQAIKNLAPALGSNYVLSFVADMLTAIKEIGRRKIDVALVDMNSDSFNSNEAIPALKARRKAGVIALIPHSFDETLVASSQILGADDYLLADNLTKETFIIAVTCAVAKSVNDGKRLMNIYASEIDSSLDNTLEFIDNVSKKLLMTA